MAKRNENSLAELEQLLGHTFHRPELLLRALTHRSFVYEAAGIKPGDATPRRRDPSLDNEQLEFLGDAALGLLVAESLCQHFPGSSEGELTQMRASLVSRRHLGKVGTRLNLGQWLRLGMGLENRGRQNATLAANAMEAVIAALFLDGGIETARQFVEREVLAEALPGLMESVHSEAEGVGGQGSFPGAVGDYKTALQELVQSESLGKPRYVVVDESGPAHQRVFSIEVCLDGEGAEFGALAQASASRKKQAQQEAARQAVARLHELGIGVGDRKSG
jgi:ribonuclease-3